MQRRRSSNPMRTPRRWIRTAIAPFAAVLIGVLAVGATYAEEASGAHGDGKASAAPAESGDHASAKGAGGEGAKGEARPSPSHPSPSDGQGPQGGTNEREKDGAPATQTGKDSTNVDTHVEPARRLDQRIKPGENPPPRVPGAQGLTRRLSPLPQAPNPVRNSIGVVVPALPRVEPPREGTHLPTVAPRLPSATTPLGSGNALAHPAKPEFANRPASPIVMAPAVNRGAINGTSVTRHNVGPARVGGPAASVAGINGTAIRSKH
jgi:hypothetical protein